MPRKPDVERDLHADVVIGQFLRFLERDIMSNAEQLRSPDSELISRTEELVKNVDVQFDAPLPADEN